MKGTTPRNRRLFKTAANWWTRLAPREKHPGSWSVASTVAEPPELLYAFVAHYLELGAQEVHLFIDDPEQPGLEPLRDLQRVRLTICDATYWKTVTGERPQAQEMRQIRNANRAYRECRSDWFFFCDADEYLCGDRSIEDILRQQPASLRHCRPHMAERAFPADRPQTHLFEGPLKTPLPKRPKVLKDTYGPLTEFVTFGLLGHVAGKSFTRTGQDDLRIRIHRPVPVPAGNGSTPPSAPAPDLAGPGPQLDRCWLVHYDGLTPLHWQLKLLRYALEYDAQIQAGVKTPFTRRLPARQRQIQAVYAALAAPSKAFEDMSPLLRPSTTMLAQLEQANGLLKQDVDPRPAARRLFSRDLAFDPQTFDDTLRTRKADMIAKYGISA